MRCVDAIIALVYCWYDYEPNEYFVSYTVCVQKGPMAMACLMSSLHPTLCYFAETDKWNLKRHRSNAFAVRNISLPSFLLELSLQMMKLRRSVT